MNLLKLVAVGHANTSNPHSMESMVTSGMGPGAHAVAPDFSAHEVIDRAQHIESDAVNTIAQPIEHIDITAPHSTVAVAHRWDTSVHLATKNIVEDFGDIPIPWQYGA